ncbi:MAG: hypothetical protein U0M51_01895 [Eggerthellaceae bacterium]
MFKGFFSCTAGLPVSGDIFLDANRQLLHSEGIFWTVWARIHPFGFYEPADLTRSKSPTWENALLRRAEAAKERVNIIEEG